MAGRKRRKRKCSRYKTKTIIQDYGPAKKVRVCASYKGGKRRRRRTAKSLRRRSRWCVFRGKGRAAQMQTCHKNKRAAKHAAAVLRRSCRSKVRIKKVKGA